MDSLELASNVTKRIANLAAGNFEYSRQVCDLIDQGLFSIEDLGKLLPGLDHMYFEVFSRRFPTEQDWNARGQPLLEILAVAKEPLDLETLSELSGNSKASVALTLGQLSSCLRQENTGEKTKWSLFHKSLKDWLLSPLLSVEFYCDPIGAHKKFVTFFSHGPRLTEYGPLNVISHAANGQLANDFATLFLDGAFRDHLRNVPGGEARLANHISHLAKETIKKTAVASTADWIARRIEKQGESEKVEVANLLFGSEHRHWIDLADKIYESVNAQFLSPSDDLRWATALYQGLDDWEKALKIALRAKNKFDAIGDEIGGARASVLVAALAFDSADPKDVDDAESLIGNMALPIFEKHERLQEYHDALETLAIVKDAEGKWEDAEEKYNLCNKYYKSTGNRVALSRLLLNRSVAALFLEGLPAALKVFNASKLQLEESSYDAQLSDYHLSMEIFFNTFQQKPLPDPHLKLTEGREDWLQLVLECNLSVLSWVKGDRSAMKTIDSARNKWASKQDKWGEVDCEINLALMRLDFQVDHELAIASLANCYRKCEKMSYPVGMAVSAFALKTSRSHLIDDCSSVDFFNRHLEPLFEHCRSIFVPNYSLLIPRLRAFSN